MYHYAQFQIILQNHSNKNSVVLAQNPYVNQLHQIEFSLPLHPLMDIQVAFNICLYKQSRNCHTDFHSQCTSLHSHQQQMNVVPLTPHSLQVYLTVGQIPKEGFTVPQILLLYHDHCCFTHNRQKLEATLMSIN